MTGMQRLNLTAALATFLYGAWQGWPILNSCEKALIAYIGMFGAQLLIFMGSLSLAKLGGPGKR